MSNQNWTKWQLWSVDSFDGIEGDYPLSDVKQTIGAVYQDAWSLNREEPITQWIHGQAKRHQFGVVMHAQHALDDIRPKFKWIEDSVKKDEKLGRPPLCLWTWGTIQVSCFIKSVSDISWQMMPPVTQRSGNTLASLQPLPPLPGATSGLPRSVTFTIELQKYTPFDLKVTDPNAPLVATLYKPAKLGQTWESFAQERYGQPLWGDVLRRLNPGMPYPLTGKVVALPDEDWFDDFVNEPESAPLLLTEEGLAARLEVYALRGVSKISHVL